MRGRRPPGLSDTTKEVGVMRIVVFGATGYIGSAVVDSLGRHHHDVVGVASTDESEKQLRERGVEVVRADLRRVSSLPDVVDDAEAVVHAASPVGDGETDRAAVDNLLRPMLGTGKTFLYTSGVWVLGATGREPADEAAPYRPAPIVAWRPAVERVVLDASGAGVRALVVRPAIVHGHRGGIPGRLVSWAREHGVGRYVADPQVRWPLVHVEDLADLYRLLLEDREAAGIYHGVAEEAVHVAALAAAADRAAGGAGRAEPWPLVAAREALGAPFADVLALDQAASSGRARRLGWRPSRPGAVEDLAGGSYAA